MQLTEDIRNAIESSSSSLCTITDNSGYENDECSMYDIIIIGKDNVQVPAVRFFLGARSKVLRKMLYGRFKEATTNTIKLDQYCNHVLEAVVEYSYTDNINKLMTFLKANDDDNIENAVEILVELCGCASYLEINQLVEIVISEVRALMKKNPPVSCAVYEECSGSIYDPSIIKLKKLACDCIRHDPELTLPISDKCRGVAYLSASSMKEIYSDHTFQEYNNRIALVTALSDWVSFDNDASNSIERNNVAKECISFIDLSVIKTSELIKTAKECGDFLTNEKLVDTYSKQALEAEKAGFLIDKFDSSKAYIARVIVSGAGTSAVNGSYFEDGEHRGQPKYTKRGHWKGNQTTFVLYFHDGYSDGAWYLAKVSEDGAIGADNNDIYCSDNGSTATPPSTGWSTSKLGKVPAPKCDVSKATR